MRGRESPSHKARGIEDVERNEKRGQMGALFFCQTLFTWSSVINHLKYDQLSVHSLLG